MDENTVLNIFLTFDLSDLDTVWVNNMYSSEFTEEPNCDLNLSPSLSSYMQDCNEALRAYSSSFSSGSSGQTRCSLLNELIQNGISSKMIQSWLYYLFHQGLKISARFEEKQLCLLAANLYFLLLKLPGMSSSELHHAILFEKAIDALLKSAQVDTDGSAGGRKRRGNHQLVSQSQKRRKRADDSTAQNIDDDNEDEVDVTPGQAAVLYNHLTSALADFCKYLATVSLRGNELSLKHAIQVLVKITNYLRSNCPVTFVDYPSFKSDGSSADSLKLPYLLAIYGLFLVVSVKHGDLDQLCLTLFRFALSILIMKDANAPSSSVPRAFFQNSEIFRRLVCHLYDTHGDAISHSISVLVQNLIAQCPDRTEFRNHISVVALCILNHMSFQWFADFCDWLKRVAFHTKIAYRSNALAVIERLLCQPQRQNSDNLEIDSDLLASVEHSSLLMIVVGRLMDVAPSVRSRALHVLVEVMEVGIVSHSALHEVVACTEKKLESVTPVPSLRARKTNTPLSLHTIPASVMVDDCVMVEGKSTLLQLLVKCAMEPKAMVRKTAVHAMEMALKYGFVTPNAVSMEILAAKCRDPSLMVRKQAITSISEVLLNHKTCAQAQAGWANGVLPTVLDAESSVQEKASALIESILLNCISGTEENSDLAWSLMAYFASAKGESLQAYLQTVCRQWRRQMKLDAVLVGRLVMELDNPSRSAAAWLFLRLFTLNFSNKNIAMKIADMWMVEYKKENTLMFHINSIITIGQVCKFFSFETQRKVMDICVQRLKMLYCPIQLISYLVETTCNLIEALYKDSPDVPKWPKPLMEWCQIMLKESDEFLYKTIMNDVEGDGTIAKERALIHQLYIAGNIGKHCATKVPKRLLLSMQALLTSTECLTNVTQSQASQQDLPPSQPFSQFVQKGGVPQHIRAHAVLNLGKICLHNPQLAKKCVPAMVRELDTCDSDMVRNNVLIILTDLCVQQTQLVDPYLADMANCLGDESSSVRRNALILINGLLKKDFVKWRGSLIYKFLIMLCDESVDVQNLVKFSLVSQTLRRNAGDVFFRHFVEAIFYFNAYSGHNVFNRFSKSERESRLFNISGNAKKEDRMSIYCFMLEHMDDEHRIKLTGKLCSDILDAVVDGAIPLNNNADDVLADALAVLCSQDLKLKCMKATDEDQDMDMMQNEVAAAAKNAMKQKIISHVVKKNLLENIMPIIIALKNTLVAKKSSLVRNVMLCLKEIMKDYKTEVQDILTADKQLASEIEFDLKRFDREQEERLHSERVPTAHSATRPGSIAPPITLTPPSGDVTPQQDQPEEPCQNTNASMRQKENVPSNPDPLRTPLVQMRTKGLGITAVLNSAKKTMERLTIADSELDENDSRVPDRAISTPARITAFGDLTFSNLNEISAISFPNTK